MKRLSLLLICLALASGCASVSDRVAQGVERGAQRAAEREASRQADRAVTNVMRGAENAVICIVTDAECVREARAQGRAVEVQDQNGSVVQQYPAPDGSADVNNNAAAFGRTLFYSDFSGDALGRFPGSLEFVRGNWEVAEWNGRRLLRNTGPRNSAFRVILPEVLPDSFSISFELFAPHNQRITLLTEPPENPNLYDVEANFVQITAQSAGGSGVGARGGSGLPTSLNAAPALENGIVPVQIVVEGEYTQVFVAGDRVANLPNAYLPRTEALHFQITEPGTEDWPVYLGPIRVTAPETP